MVALLTLDQKVACLIHVGFISSKSTTVTVLSVGVPWPIKMCRVRRVIGKAFRIQQKLVSFHSTVMQLWHPVYDSKCEGKVHSHELKWLV